MSSSQLTCGLKYHESILLLTGSSGGFQVSSNSCTALDRTLMSSSWRPEGSELPDCSGSDPAHSSFSEAEMDMASSPSSWPKATNPSMLVGGRNSPRGRKSGNAATVGFDGTARRRSRRQERGGSPAARWRQWAHPEQAANHIAAGPEHADRAKSTVGLVQRRLGVARPRQATQWRCWSSGSMGPAQILHTEAITSSRWSKRFWYNCREHRIYTVSSSSFACFATIGQSFDWREPIGLQERLKGRSSHNGEISVMSRDSSIGNRKLSPGNVRWNPWEKSRGISGCW